MQQDTFSFTYFSHIFNDRFSHNLLAFFLFWNQFHIYVFLLFWRIFWWLHFFDFILKISIFFIWKFLPRLFLEKVWGHETDFLFCLYDFGGFFIVILTEIHQGFSKPQEHKRRSPGVKVGVIIIIIVLTAGKWCIGSLNIVDRLSVWHQMFFFLMSISDRPWWFTFLLMRNALKRNVFIITEWRGAFVFHFIISIIIHRTLVFVIALLWVCLNMFV